jgi:Fe-S cluster biosynthesis and repair protein YggX
MARLVNCVKLGIEAEGLSTPPFPGALGQRIFEQVSKEAWRAWVEHQKMLINEKRLSLDQSSARKYLNEQMLAYFFGTGAEQASGYVPPRNS